MRGTPSGTNNGAGRGSGPGVDAFLPVCANKASVTACSDPSVELLALSASKSTVDVGVAPLPALLFELPGVCA
jgi:hypothetical protein